MHPDHDLALPLDPAFEHALLVPDGDVTLEGQPLEQRLLIGGAPFGESILMWWNFVARTPDEIRTAREAPYVGRAGL